MSERTKGVHTYYSDANKILKIATIGEKALVVTDEMVKIYYINKRELSEYLAIPVTAGLETGICYVIQII